VSIARLLATTMDRRGSSSGRWIWTTKLSAVVKIVWARPSQAFVIPPADRRGVHGNDERIAVDTLVDGTAFTIELVERFATR
jgi:acetylornithine deacetylase/succinyl-diaminopimelate desuccinylase-like protein